MRTMQQRMLDAWLTKHGSKTVEVHVTLDTGVEVLKRTAGLPWMTPYGIALIRLTDGTAASLDRILAREKDEC